VDSIAEEYAPRSHVRGLSGKLIPHSRPTIEEAEIGAVSKILASGQLADTMQVVLFEKELSSYVGHAGGVATNSGTNALYLALLSLGHDSRNEVIIPSYACIALLNAIYSVQATPVVADIDECGYNICMSAVKKAITHRTRAIIAPHMFGDPISDIQEIFELDLPVIEDCALSVGASVGGRTVGSIAELAVFSFYATKLLTTGHGGMVLTSSDTTLNALRDLMQYDHRREYRPSVNFRMTDFQAALGRSQLTRLDDFITRRRQIAAIYDEGFEQAETVAAPPRAEQSVYFRYIVQVGDADAWIERMLDKGVDCKKPVYRPLHQYLGLDAAEYPNAERAHRHNVSIPIYPSLGEREIECIIRAGMAC
jgi:perosamine synthetase